MGKFVGALLFVFCFFAVSKPAFVDRYGRVYAERTICGKDDMIGLERAGEPFVSMSRPIGQTRRLARNGQALCTGTLIGPDLYLTARHCYVDCSKTRVTFGYYRGGQPETFECESVLEKGGGEQHQDYMILRLKGKPGIKWGWYGVSAAPLRRGQKLLMLHHPAGRPMQVSQKDCFFKNEAGGMFFHRCDTLGGSSGSGILLPDYRHHRQTRIVAVHGYGGCNETDLTSANSGPSIRSLIRISPTLKTLASQ